MSLQEFFFGFSDETKAKHPCLFIERGINRHKCKRTVPMKVLCLSMGRTGTASMKAALEQLGYPTSHGFDLHENIQDGDMWKEAINAKWYGDTSIKLDTAFWDKLLGHVSAITDFPANMFGPELIAAYPDAKVILVERDVDKWYPSFEQALIVSNDHPLITGIIGQLDPKVKKLGPLVSHGMMRGQFRSQNSIKWRQNAKRVYEEHYASLRALLADEPDRLLNFELAEGWEPLCGFLGQSKPDAPLPRINETAQHDDMIKVAMTQMSRGILMKLFIYASPMAVAGFAWKCWQS